MGMVWELYMKNTEYYAVRVCVWKVVGWLGKTKGNSSYIPMSALCLSMYYVPLNSSHLSLSSGLDLVGAYNLLALSVSYYYA